MPNRLADAKSPYLQQHAENPVDWYPWGDEAFEQARQDDKPVLVSIGYSACHWCHVMAHESFENPSVARLMNDHFVNIKVDREERPDVDAVYMEAVQMMTGQGGWPLNVFVTPDRKPFFGGTYFPPSPRPGMPSWPQVLQSVALAWRNERSRLEESATSLISHVARSNELQPSEDPLGPEILDQAFETMELHFDRQHGGFGGAPKFPQPMNLGFLLRTWKGTGNEPALEMATLTLEKMAGGGIYDHIGGGFHRYSVDESWTVPHFEKMLYDNALLSRLYVEAWQATGSQVFRSVAEGTLDYVLRDMTSPEGGFYSSEDADSEGEEGKFYVWTPDEIRGVLSAREAELFCRYFDVADSGNFEGKSILTISASTSSLSKDFGMSEEEVEASLGESAQRLRAARESRVRPGRDEKILTDWNALMLQSLVLAGRAFDRDDYLEAGRANASFLLTSLRQDGQILHVYNQGAADIAGYLDDHAFLIEALLSLFEATGEARWLESASQTANTMLDAFRDTDGAGFFTSSASEARALPVRPKSLFDNVIPSGNSSATMALLRLSAIVADVSCDSPALDTIRLVRNALGQHALSFGYMLSALDFYLNRGSEVVIIGRRHEDDTRSLRRELYGRFLPDTIRLVTDPSESLPDIPLLAGRGTVNGHATAYVCRNYACQAPVTDPESLAAQLSQSVAV